MCRQINVLVYKLHMDEKSSNFFLQKLSIKSNPRLVRPIRPFVVCHENVHTFVTDR